MGRREGGGPAEFEPFPVGGALERARTRVERRTRRAWREGPGLLLRAASLAWSAASGARGLLYRAGLLRPRRAPVPVISIGGLTVGGGGKTPLAAETARWLAETGAAPGIITPGATDEAEVHAVLEPRARSEAERDRLAAALRLASQGCRAVVLDSGFQHRRLARDLDVVTLEVETAAGPHRALPAGPFREPLAALGRADFAVLVRREAEPAARDRIRTEIRARWPRLPLASCRLFPGACVAVNEAARGEPRPDPAVAVAGLMQPEIFLRQAGARFPGLAVSLPLRDHYPYPAEAATRLAAIAGARGIVCTLKDAVKLRARLGEAVPIWYLEDRLEWEAGGEELRRRVLAAAGVTEERAGAAGGGRCRW